jgi:hypothetical protein
MLTSWHTVLVDGLLSEEESLLLFHHIPLRILKWSELLVIFGVNGTRTVHSGKYS